jgi:triosephosphate isomerase
MGMTARRRLIAGNWKMNGRLESAAALGAGLIEGLASRQDLQAGAKSTKIAWISDETGGAGSLGRWRWCVHR